MMKTVVVETEVQEDGRLRLDIPVDLPPGRVEVVLVIQPAETSGPPYPALAGRWRGLFPPDFDLDRALHEIRHAWEQEWEGFD
ncbi:MAG: hypothetical protein D6759_09090 [Chloroflexi bacterium]|nr:MAG: hypothetical protein D6759_09090 [Chloroflexota bacterium]